jgi:hypothetical protein
LLEDEIMMCGLVLLVGVVSGIVARVIAYFVKGGNTPTAT